MAMRLTGSLVLKVALAVAPAALGSYVTYRVGHDKTADGYAALAESVNQLQGAVEQVRLQVQHLQDLHFSSEAPPAALRAAAPLPRLKLKSFKRMPSQIEAVAKR